MKTNHFGFDKESNHHHHDSVVDDLSSCLVLSKMAMNYE